MNSGGKTKKESPRTILVADYALRVSGDTQFVAEFRGSPP